MKSALTALIFILPVSAAGHDALPTAAQPEGWSYPTSCCSGYDCRQVPASMIKETGAGYTIMYTGEFLYQNDPKIRPSPDGMYHWCSVAGEDTGKTLCLFVPQPAF